MYSQKLNEHEKRIPIINITSKKRSDIKDLVNELYGKLCMCMHQAVCDVNGDAKKMGNLPKQNAVGGIMIVELQETETDYIFIYGNLQVALQNY